MAARERRDRRAAARVETVNARRSRKRRMCDDRTMSAPSAYSATDRAGEARAQRPSQRAGRRSPSSPSTRTVREHRDTTTRRQRSPRRRRGNPDASRARSSPTASSMNTAVCAVVVANLRFKGFVFFRLSKNAIFLRFVFITNKGVLLLRKAKRNDVRA